MARSTGCLPQSRRFLTKAGGRGALAGDRYAAALTVKANESVAMTRDVIQDFQAVGPVTVPPAAAEQ